MEKAFKIAAKTVYRVFRYNIYKCAIIINENIISVHTSTLVNKISPINRFTQIQIDMAPSIFHKISLHN